MSNQEHKQRVERDLRELKQRQKLEKPEHRAGRTALETFETNWWRGLEGAVRDAPGSLLSPETRLDSQNHVKIEIKNTD